MKHIQIKKSVITRAIQLREENYYEVHTILMSESTNIQSISIEHPKLTRFSGYGSRSVSFKGVYDNRLSAGITVKFIEGSCLQIHLLDWLVVIEKGGVKHVTVFDSFDFPALFDLNTNDVKEKNSFNMSLLGNNNIQSFFKNSNDYRLFTYIANSYCNQLPDKGVKNNIIILKAPVVMGICRISDKTFRKSRNNLIEMGIIYHSSNGFKISFETLNNLISGCK